jgi:hypothetical protein
MRKDAIDEFESLFEQAPIPVLDIEEVPLIRASPVRISHPPGDTILSPADTSYC